MRAGAAAERADLRSSLRGRHHLPRHVETDHLDRDAAGEDDVRGFGIARDYRGMSDVAQRAAFLVDTDGTVRGAWAYEAALIRLNMLIMFDRSGSMQEDDKWDNATAALKALCSRISWCEPAVLESVLELALEIAREGREGRRIGTLFTLGKADAVLAASRALILDPLAGHTPARTHITDPDLRGTMKELAQLDGAFVISEDGTVVAACRYLDASVEQIALPLGFGSRHLAAASVSQRIGAVAIVVSESGVVRVFHAGQRVFHAGQIEATLIPELWLLDRHHTQLSIAAAGAVEAQRLGTATFSLSDVGENS